jgi:hypothetical protein
MRSINSFQKSINPQILIGLFLLLMMMLWFVQLASTREMVPPSQAEAGINSAQNSGSTLSRVNPGAEKQVVARELAGAARQVSNDWPVLNFFASSP